jgi:hypothetical protein
MADFSGSLKDDSPSCIKLIQTTFGKEAQTELSELYSDLFANKILQEPKAFRPEGARFNPRPARLTHILLTEVKITTFEQILKAFRFCFDPNSLIVESPQVLPARDFELYRQASFLDEVRHLHMNKGIKREQLQAVLLFGQSLFEDSNALMNPRLMTLISTYLVRINRFSD